MKDLSLSCARLCYMKGLLCLFFGLIIFPSSISAQSYYISLIAGNGTHIDGPNGARATSSGFNYAASAWSDSNENVYIGELTGCKVRVVDASGSINDFIGSGICSETKTSGPALTSAIGGVRDVKGDRSGQYLYFTTLSNIWRYNFNTTIISTYLDNGGYADGPITSAKINQPKGLYLATNGLLYFADYGNHRIRAINTTSNNVTTFAGNGSASFTGDDGPAIYASLNHPFGVGGDSTGLIYIADQRNYRIRLVNSSGIITTVAGKGNCLGYLEYLGDGGYATNACLDVPSDVKADRHGNYFIAENGACRIRMVNTSRIITTIVGTGSCGAPSLITGPSISSNLDGLNWISNDYFGDLIIAQSNGYVSKVYYYSSPTSIPTSLPSLPPSSSPTVGMAHNFDFSGQTVNLTVPSDANVMYVDITGAAGGSPLNCSSTTDHPGYGARVQAYLSVRAGSVLHINVGGVGGFSGCRHGGPGGWNGGGSATLEATGGGGASDIRVGGTSLSDRIIVAGGGGGYYYGNCGTQKGGDGGKIGLNGTAVGGGCCNGTEGIGAGGGNQISGGSKGNSPGGNCGNGAPGVLEVGGNGDNAGAGGGGYYGGGSGGSGGSGGGGSSYCKSASANYSTGFQTSSGYVKIVFHLIQYTPSSPPTSSPSNRPFATPTSQPTKDPTNKPSSLPSSRPSTHPSYQPTSFPSDLPTSPPTAHPSSRPSSKPAGLPSSHPTFQPTSTPTRQPSSHPSTSPSLKPSSHPSGQPSSPPSGQPSIGPSGQPTNCPTTRPSSKPSTGPTVAPSHRPSNQPSTQPSSRPSRLPSSLPSDQPSSRPTGLPSRRPSSGPSSQPTSHPSNQPSNKPSSQPTSSPSLQPISLPSSSPTSQPSTFPSSEPSKQPSDSPSSEPSSQPSKTPTSQPSNLPSAQPSPSPTVQPSASPSLLPSSSPTVKPTNGPSTTPSCFPTSSPSQQPTTVPTAPPTSFPSSLPSSPPSSSPSATPSIKPSSNPSAQPSVSPSDQPSAVPSAQPSDRPSDRPTVVPSAHPSSQPSSIPSSDPTSKPSTAAATKIFRNSQMKQFLFVFGFLSAASSSSFSFVTSSQSFVLFGGTSLSQQSEIILSATPSFYNALPVEEKLSFDLPSRSYAMIGDINADLVNDWISCLPLESLCQVLFGDLQTALSFSFSDITATTAMTVRGEREGDMFGWAVSAAGDMNHDGIADVVIAARDLNRCYVIYGKAEDRKILTGASYTVSDWLQKNGGFVILGSESGYYTGVSVSFAGDFNRDGRADIILTQMSESNVNTITIIFGSSKTRNISLDHFNSSLGYQIIAPALSYAGLSLAGIGDCNGDGFDDVLLGSLIEKSYVILGKGEGFEQALQLSELKAPNGFVLSGGGFLVSGIGDITGDGLADLMVTSYTAWRGKGNSYQINFPHNMTMLPSLQPSSSPSSVPSYVIASAVNEPSLAPNSLSEPPPAQSPSTAIAATDHPSHAPHASPSSSSSLPSSLSPSSVKPSAFRFLRTTAKPSSQSPTVQTSSSSSFRPISLSPSEVPVTRPTRSIISAAPSTTENASRKLNFTTIFCDLAGAYYGHINRNEQFIIRGEGDIEIYSRGGSAAPATSSNDQSRKVFLILSSQGPSFILLYGFDSSRDILDLSHFPQIQSIEDISFLSPPLEIVLSMIQDVQIPQYNSFDLTDANFFFAPKPASSSDFLVKNADNLFILLGAVLGMIVVGAIFLRYRKVREKRGEQESQHILSGKHDSLMRERKESVLPKFRPAAEEEIVQRRGNIVSLGSSSSSGSSKEVRRIFSDRDSRKSSNASSYYILSKDSNASLSFDDLERGTSQTIKTTTTTPQEKEKDETLSSLKSEDYLLSCDSELEREIAAEYSSAGSSKEVRRLFDDRASGKSSKNSSDYNLSNSSCDRSTPDHQERKTSDR